MDDLNEKWISINCQGSGWSLHSIRECVVHIASCDKDMRKAVPLKNISVGTFCPIPVGLHGHNHLVNLRPGGNKEYNCLDACIRLHLSSLKNPEILVPGHNKGRYTTLMNRYDEFKNAAFVLPKKN